MQDADLLISARWVLPIAPNNIVLENHSVAIQNGKILAVLPTTTAKQQFSAKKMLELKDHAIMPGLVNAHTHTPMNLFRGLADDLELMDWLQKYIWPAEQAIINDQSVHAGSQLAIAEMLRGGTTCFNDHYFFPDAIAKTAIDSGIRASVGLVVMSVPTGWASDENTYFIKAKETLQNGPQHELITYAVAPHAPYTVSNNSLEQIKKLSDEHDLQIHMHVQETAFECEESVKQYNKRPLARLHELGLLSDKFINVHMTCLTDEEIELVKETSSHIVHCPESNLKLASGFANVPNMLAANINVALGTDGAASNNDLDMLGEMQTAAMIAKAVALDPTAVPAPTALKMATLNGAKALGLGDKIGSLEAGKAADMIAVDLSSYLTQPIFHPMSQLVYAVNRLQVSDVWVNGKHLLSQGEFTELDVDKAVADARPWIKQAEPFKSKASSVETVEV
jgi:5-methylthioadenosine/S-adenosylhomocysteine deaminase